MTTYEILTFPTRFQEAISSYKDDNLIEVEIYYDIRGVFAVMTGKELLSSKLEHKCLAGIFSLFNIKVTTSGSWVVALPAICRVLLQNKEGYVYSRKKK